MNYIKIKTFEKIIAGLVLSSVVFLAVMSYNYYLSI